MTTPTPPAFQDPLQQLLIEALAKIPARRERKTSAERILAGELTAAEARVRRMFTDPENWTQTRTVALVHAETHTLLGNYAEHLHNKVPGCRRLVRVDTPCEVQGLEEVKGPDWVGTPLGQFGNEEIEPTVIETVANVFLAELDRVYAHAVLLSCHVQHGSLIRVEVFEETRFFSKDGRAILDLPEGTDILKVLDPEQRNEIVKGLNL